MVRRSSILLLLLLVPFAALAKGPRWTNVIDGVRISIAGRPVGTFPLFPQPGDASAGKAGYLAYIASKGNEAMARVRDTQAEWSWFRGSVEPVDGSTTFRWPSDLPSILLSDGTHAEAIAVIATRDCGPMLLGCKPIDLFPMRNEISYQDIRVAEVDDCMVWIAFRIPTVVLEKAEIVDLQWVDGERGTP